MKNLLKKIYIGLFITSLISLLTFLLDAKIDLFEKLIIFLEKFERYEIDELFFVGLVLFFALIVLAFILLHENSVLKYQAEVNKLKDLLPICAYCKKIRDSEGYWHQVEAYINKQTGTRFSHGICEVCEKKLLSELK